MCKSMGGGGAVGEATATCALPMRSGPRAMSRSLKSAGLGRSASAPRACASYHSKIILDIN